MPASQALTEFLAAARIVDALLTLEGHYADPPGPNDEDSVRGLRGGAAVMMVAAFEQFFRSVLPERIAAIAAHLPSIAFDDLPKNLRVTAIFNSLSRALDGPRHQRTDRLSRIPAIRVASSIVTNKGLMPGAFTPERSPLPQHISAECESIGLKRVFTRMDGPFRAAWTKPEAATFVVDKLIEVVLRRHSVAHTANALNVARSDLHEGLRFLRTLAPVIDQEIERHIDWIVANPGKEPP